jgi:hypothetical protein
MRMRMKKQQRLFVMLKEERMEDFHLHIYQRLDERKREFAATNFSPSASLHFRRRRRRTPIAYTVLLFFFAYAERVS